MGWYVFLIAVNAYWMVAVCRMVDRRKKRQCPGKPDYNKIRQLEKDLGLNRSPEDAPKLPAPGDRLVRSVEDGRSLYAFWGEEDEVPPQAGYQPRRRTRRL